MRIVSLLFAFILFTSFSLKETETWKEKTENADYIHRAVKVITDVMVHDIYSPPVAGRTYAYISIAGYEAAIVNNSTYQTLAGQLRGLKTLPKPKAGVAYSPTIAAVQAILTVGKTMVVSEERLNAFYADIVKELKASGIPDDAFAASIECGTKIAAEIIAWAGKDNYKQTRTFSKYAVSNDPAVWKPTPPAYIKAVEPHWNRIRPFLLDSAQQFKPLPATPFSTDKASLFYKEAMNVHEVCNNLSTEQKQVADFWDCNPFKVNVNGHVMYASKKISPGGHWMNIVRLACQKVNADVQQTTEAYVCTAVTIADAFVSCWDEKYRSQVIRPETYINQYIDGAWMPYLQTPPFPEYTSGHSVLSTASAVVLSKIFGENFSYADSTEVEFGIPVRSFSSFKQAAEEAAISRLYGGIHYMPSIVNGAVEGKKIGEFMVKRLHTRNDAALKKTSQR